ncbi:MAG: DUF3783 domain-containing protein [Eubacteriales bacterium]|nr:DUF3783 domain-containing protein [Eubacteriales bacterium]
MKSPTMLYYNLQEGRAGDIRRIAEELGIRVRAVDKNEYHQTLAALCGLQEKAPGASQGEGFEEEMLVMAFFPEGLLGQLLDAIRAVGIAPVALKAVLTENNARWNSVKLNLELMEEYAYFRGQQEARRQEDANKA